MQQDFSACIQPIRYSWCAALQSGALAGAALDVVECEPLDPASPLWSMDNVIISPHCAYHTDTVVDDMQQVLLSNTQRFVRNEALTNVHDFYRGY